jgi:hypothetical protein
VERPAPPPNITAEEIDRATTVTRAAAVAGEEPAE